ARVKRKRWNRDPYPLMMATLPFGSMPARGAPIIPDVKKAALALARATPRDILGNVMGIYSVDTPVNPHELKPGRRYVTVYTGLLYAPETGEYRFAVNAGGAAHLFIDCRRVQTATGHDSAAGPWRKTSRARLDEGIHNFTILHGETTRRQGIKVGWRPPGARELSTMSGSAFARSNYAPVELVGYEKHAEPTTPFFTVDQVGTAYQLPDGTVKAFVKLTNRTLGSGLRYLWRVGNATYTGPSPRTFVNVAGESDPDQRKQLASFPISLEVFKGGKSLGTYERTMKLTSLARVKVDAHADLQACPEILYDGEPTGATFNVRNLSEDAVPFRYRWTRAARRITLAPRARRELEAAVAAPDRDGGVAAVTLTLSAGGRPVGEATVEIRRAGGHCASRLVRLGRRLPAGRPVITHRPGDVVYEGRRARVRFGLVNPSDRPVTVECAARLSGERSRAGTLELAAAGADSVRVELPAPTRGAPRAEAMFTLAREGRRIAEAAVAFRHDGRRVVGKVDRLGHRLGEDGPRVRLAVGPDDIAVGPGGAAVTFRVANQGTRPVTLGYRWRAPAETILIPPHGEIALTSECPTPLVDGAITTLGLHLRRADRQAAEAAIRLEREGGRVRARLRRLGQRTTPRRAPLGLAVDPAGVVIAEDFRIRPDPSRGPRLKLRVRNGGARRLALTREWLVPGERPASNALSLPADAATTIELRLPEPEHARRATLRLWRKETHLADVAVTVGRTADGALSGTVSRAAPAGSAPAPVGVRIDPGQVVYNSERALVTFRASNGSSRPVRASYDWAVPLREVTGGEIEVAAGGRRPIDVPLPVPAGRDGVAATFSVWVADVMIGGASVHVVRPSRRLRRLHTKLGHLVDGRGRRVALLMRPEDQARHRRWALVKWIAGKVRSGPATVLLYGDPMTNAPGGGDSGYVDVVSARLEASSRTVTFAENRRGAVAPVLADLPAFAAALAEHRPELVILSPGSADALKGVPANTFSRAVDAMIDVARDQPGRPRLVLVTPPPLVSNPKQSGALAKAMRMLARRHRLPCVDLHRLVRSRSDWKAAYQEAGGADDGLYHLYPNASVQKDLAEAILRAIP
ncbi:MAG: GDSL-type esterase/lipase family protein, partial [Planctomycetota bacterium]